MQQQLNPMKESQKPIKRYLVDFRKHSISQKTRSDITNPFRSKDEAFTALPCHGIKNFGRKYVQQNLFKAKYKDHHEIVISDELVRNSRQFRMLREKMQMRQAIYTKQCNQLNQSKCKLKQEISQIKSSSYNSKLTLWELKNQILQLKNILNEEEDESRRIQKELMDPRQQYYQEQQNQYNQQENYPNVQQQNHMNSEEQQDNNSLRIDSKQKQSQEDEQQLAFELLVSPTTSKLNPQILKDKGFFQENLD